VRRLILRTAVRLDLDDAGDAPPRAVVADQAGTEQRPGGVRRGTGEDPPVEDVQDFGYIASILSGTRNPNRTKNAGISVALKKSTIADESRNVQKSRRNCSSVSRGGAFNR
jgi:hypothetical protein